LSDEIDPRNNISNSLSEHLDVVRKL